MEDELDDLGDPTSKLARIKRIKLRKAKSSFIDLIEERRKIPFCEMIRATYAPKRNAIIWRCLRNEQELAQEIFSEDEISYVKNARSSGASNDAQENSAVARLSVNALSICRAIGATPEEEVIPRLVNGAIEGLVAAYKITGKDPDALRQKARAELIRYNNYESSFKETALFILQTSLDHPAARALNFLKTLCQQQAELKNDATTSANERRALEQKLRDTRELRESL